MKKMICILMSAVLLTGMAPTIPVASAAETCSYLTDVNGRQMAQVGKMAADNHEIIDINITDGKTHKVTVYLLDEDASGRWTMVDVIDPDTQKILDNQNVYNFQDGVYLSYNISGHLQIRLTNVWTKRYIKSKDTAVHGVFIDGEDAVAGGTATVTTEEPKENEDAQKMEYVNVLGRFVNAGEDYDIPFDKEAQSVEMRFDGSVDPSSENIDQIKVLKNGIEVPGEMRTGFYSVTFKPDETMRTGNYEVVVPATLKNTLGEKIGKDYSTKFKVEPSVDIVYFLNGMNLQTRRVELTFNDRIKNYSMPDATLVYNKGEIGESVITTGSSGQNAGKSYEIKSPILPNGKYTFTLPKGVESVSGAKSTEDYVNEFQFDSAQLSAQISAPNAVSAGENFDIQIKESIGYGEVRYAFSEETLKDAVYQPVTPIISASSEGFSGEQTLYVQFRVAAGSQKGIESPILHKSMKMGVMQKGEILPFDMESAKAYDKDGFGSVENPKDGVFDLATDIWGSDTSNYIADGDNGLSGRYDQDKDSIITTEDGIQYRLSSALYTDGMPNVATGNGKEIPAPSDNAYEKIYVLAAGKGDDNEGTFSLNYTDGTKDTQIIDAHYWADANAHSENIVFQGISACLGWSSNNIYSMGVMRQYELEPDPEKELESVTLPSTSNLIRIFAMTGKEADQIAGGEVKSATDNMTVYSKDNISANNIVDQDLTYEDFMNLYGDDPVLLNAADVTDVTNITEVPAGPRTYDPTIEAEKETPTGEYGQSLYPYARQPEKLMSYKIRMQIYGQTSNNNYELDFEDALEAIRRVDNLTRGLDKKCYLVGWQLNGHDTGFPDLSTINPRHKRPMDDTSLQSLKWLIKEAKEKYNTTITLHVNFSDAYTDDDPLSPKMLENQLAIREADGRIREMGTGWAGHKGWYVSAYANYFTGNWQDNIIKPLLTMLPELEGQSVHPDAWYSYNDPYYNLTTNDTTDAQRRYAKYLRENYNMDLTTEFESSFTGNTQDHILYFPMIWQRGWGQTNPLMTPSYIQSSVNELAYDGVTLSTSGKYFGEGTAVEPNLWNGTYGPVELPGLKQSFAEKELTRQYLNTLLRSSLTDSTDIGGEAVLYAGDGSKVVSEWNGNATIPYKRTVTVEDDVVLQEPGNVFMPMTWRSGLEIQAWSQNGYTDKTWKLPKEWEGVEKVDVYDLTVEGLRYQTSEDVSERTFTMTMSADQSAVIVPAGKNPNSTETFRQNGTVQFIGRDTDTDGNWTKVYGKQGYEIFNSELGANMPASVEVSYLNGEVKRIQTGQTEYVEATKVTLDKVSVELKVGEKLTLGAEVKPDNATDTTVVWSSSNPETVSVTKNGEVEALARGNAVIKAQLGNLYAECMVKVVQNVTVNDLQKLLEEAIAADSGIYTSESMNNLKKVIKTVEGEIKADMLESRCSQLYDELKAAINALETSTKPVCDKSDLQKLYDKWKNESKAYYTDDTWNRLTKILNESKTLLLSDEATQKELDAKKADFETAISELKTWYTVSHQPPTNTAGNTDKTEDKTTVPSKPVSISKVVSKADTTLKKDGFYYDKNDKILINTVIKINSKDKIFLNGEGEKCISTIVTVSDKERYLVDKEGMIIRGSFVTYDNITYYTSKTSGKIVSGKLFKRDGHKYYANKSGKIVKNKWIKVGNKKYFCNTNGVITKSKKVK